MLVVYHSVYLYVSNVSKKRQWIFLQFGEVVCVVQCMKIRDSLPSY